MRKHMKYFIFILFIVSCSSVNSEKWNNLNKVLKIKKQNWETVMRIINNPDSLESIINEAGIATIQLTKQITGTIYSDIYMNHIKDFFQDDITLYLDRLDYSSLSRGVNIPSHKIILKNEKADRVIIFKFIKNSEGWFLKSILTGHPSIDDY